MTFTNFFLGLNIIIVVAMWIFIIVTQQQLPEIVPIHFDLQGNPDGFGTKNTNWLMPIIATLIFFLMQYVAKNTDSPLLSIPDSLRNDKKLTALFVQIMTTIVLSLFLIIEVGSYQVATQNEENLGYGVLIGLGFLFVFMFGFFAYANKRSKNKV